MSSYYLWLDDYRPIPKPSTHEWALAKNLAEFKSVIENCGIPFYVSFDHDLGDLHYAHDYSDEKTGLDCIKWLIDYVEKLGAEPPYWGVHTMNVCKIVPMTETLERAWPGRGRSFKDMM